MRLLVTLWEKWRHCAHQALQLDPPQQQVPWHQQQRQQQQQHKHDAYSDEDDVRPKLVLEHGGNAPPTLVR
jgi:hypothetical protein